MILILKIFAFSEQQVVKTHCLSEVIEVEIDEEENEKPRKKTKQSDKKKKKTKKVTVYSQELEDKVTRFCVYALKTPMVSRPLSGDVQSLQQTGVR